MTKEDIERFSDYCRKHPWEVPKRKYIDYKYKNHFASILSVTNADILMNTLQAAIVRKCWFLMLPQIVAQTLKFRELNERHSIILNDSVYTEGSEKLYVKMGKYFKVYPRKHSKWPGSR